jgi:hypothetical protein
MKLIDISTPLKPFISPNAKAWGLCQLQCCSSPDKRHHRLDDKIAARVDRYGAFIYAPSDEVLNHALDYVLSKDRDFQEFLKSSDAAVAAP